MERLLIIAGIGFVAQLVDGALGMGYGVTTTTLLLTAGTAPAIASATVHLAEVGTSFVSGAAHAKFGNVDWRIVGIMAVPGGVMAFLGATVLTNLSAEAAEPLIAGFLLILGLYILARFAGAIKPIKPGATPLRKRFLIPVAGAGGFLDAAGGGGWGPIGTTTLVASGRVEPRKAIGSIGTAEFIIAVSASLGFLLGLGGAAIAWSTVGALLAAGMVAAPIAAWVVRHLDPRLLGAGVGSILLLTNTNTLLGSTEPGPTIAAVAWSAIALAVLAAVVVTVRRMRRSGRPALHEDAAPSTAG